MRGAIGVPEPENPGCNLEKPKKPKYKIKNAEKYTLKQKKKYLIAKGW